MYQTPYYPTQSAPPMDNFAPGPATPTVSSVSTPIRSVIPPPQDKDDDGDVMDLERNHVLCN